MKAWRAVLVLAAAIAVWIWRMGSADAPTEAALRETRGIEVEVLSAQVAPRGFEATCRVRNTTARAAQQVVLEVSFLDDEGRLLAVNPLVGVAGLPPHGSEDLHVMAPFAGEVAAIGATSRVSLVRWRP